MKGTRLWQAPGSPIIQGRSRTLRAFWQSWLVGALAAGVVVLGVAVALQLWRGGVPLREAFSGVLGAAGGLGFLGCVVGAAGGAGLARSMGWRRERLAGCIAGALLAGLLVLWF